MYSCGCGGCTVCAGRVQPTQMCLRIKLGFSFENEQCESAHGIPAALFTSTGGKKTT